MGLRPAMLDRLRLTEQRAWRTLAAVRQVIALPDPVGRVTKMETRPNGLQIGRKTVLLGVIAIIYPGAAQCDGRCGGALLPQIRQCLYSLQAAAKSPSGRTAARRR